MDSKLSKKNALNFLLHSMALAILVHASAHADLASLIETASEQPDQISVIVPVSQSPDDSYGLLSMHTADFTTQLELTDSTKLENSYFKIVSDESSDALSVGDFDGDNVLYHLMQARNYYEKLARNSDFSDSALQNKITVRIRVDHGYNLVTHFAQWKDYNNSRYIPGSFAGDPAGQWQQEIWFDARKSEFNGTNWYSVAVSSGLALATQSWLSLSATPLQIFDQYNAGIDAAKQPGVIYHEAFHYSTDAAGFFPMASEGNPVAEDYANYFGASLLGRAQIADLMEYSGKYYKRDYSKIEEIKDTTPLSGNYNSISFGPSVMWKIREILGQARADQMIWNSLKYINGTFLATDEEKALSSAAHEDADLSPNEVTQMEDLLNRYHSSYVNLELKANPGELHLLDQQTLQNAANKLAGDSDQLRQEASKPGFRGKVLSLLNKIASSVENISEDSIRALGYADSAIFAASNAPVNFGTDLVTGIALGRGMISENNRNSASEWIGAGGGIASVYYTYVGLDALGYTLANPTVSISFGGVLVDSLLCQGSDPNGATDLDHYCVENSKIMNTVSTATAKGGAEIGDAIHKEILRIKNFFEKKFN